MPQIRMEFEGVRKTQLDGRLLEEGEGRLRGVSGLGEVEIVVAGDLSGSVHSRLPADEARAFHPERVSGRVGAKTITTADGCSIVIDARLLFPGAAAGAGVDVPRLFEHEAWHCALAHHGEDFHSSCNRLDVTGARGHYLGQALILIDEYRIELSLIEGGSALDESYLSSTAGILDRCAAALLDAVTLRYPGEPLTRCYESALPAFNSMTTHLGYLAAADAVVDDLREFPRWRRLVGDHYDQMKDALDDLPSSRVRVAPAAIDATAFELERVLEAWLREVGFVVRDVPSGLYLDVLRHDF